MTIDTGRFLLDRDAADAETYAITDTRDVIVAVFSTGGVNGKSADDTAIGNLADASEGYDGVLTLLRAKTSFGAFGYTTKLATAYGGCYNREEAA